MKGISLPVNAIVVIAIAILVLAVLAGFFTGFLGSGIVTVTTEQAFNRGCDALIRVYDCDPNEIPFIIIQDYPREGDDTHSLWDVCGIKGYGDSPTCARACGCRNVPEGTGGNTT